jgi:hypothetical protein
MWNSVTVVLTSLSSVRFRGPDLLHTLLTPSTLFQLNTLATRLALHSPARHNHVQDSCRQGGCHGPYQGGQGRQPRVS